MDDDVRALTVRQPWSWAIVAGVKDVENRGVRINRRGLLLIHAGTQLDPVGVSTLHQYGVEPPELVCGAIIGAVHVVTCVDDSQSIWAHPGRWHWVLDGARMFEEPIPARGQMGLWRPPPDVTARACAALLH